MTKDQLLTKLDELQVLSRTDPEQAHPLADEALVQFIDDPDVSDAYARITRWFA